MAGSFSSFHLNVTSSKKPFLTTLPSPASPPQSLYHMPCFVMFTAHIIYLKLPFYLFVYSFINFLPMCKHHEGRDLG